MPVEVLLELLRLCDMYVTKLVPLVAGALKKFVGVNANAYAIWKTASLLSNNDEGISGLEQLCLKHLTRSVF